MNKAVLWNLVGLATGISIACVPTSLVVDPTHCAANDGDDFCADKHPDGSAPFCSFGTKSCDEMLGITDPDVDGCVDARPPDECYSACGDVRPLSEDPECDPTSATGSSTGGADGDTVAVDSTDGEDTLSVLTDDGSSTDDASTDTSSTDGGGCVDNDDCRSPGAPFCNDVGTCVACDVMPDGNAACADADASNPVCDQGACVQCTAAAADACDGSTPVCNTDNTCQACSEHSECSASACHLDGAEVGACFDERDVQMIANVGQLNTALGGLGGSDQAVLVLAAGDYGTAIGLADNVEVAFLSESGAELSGTGAFDSVTISSSAIAYFDSIEIAGNSNAGGLSCSGTSVWLDDSEVRNNAQVGLDVSGGCAAHLRRTVVAVNNAGGLDIAGGELHMRNSVVARNGDEFSSTVGGIALDGTIVDITYSTIAINEALTAARGSLFCSGGESGSIRNNIIVADGNTIDGCAAALLANNAVDDSGIGGSNDNVGAADPGWFSNVGANNFHLSITGETVFMDIAQWQDGDPTTDVDGDPIPTDMPSFPGYDQP